jgi:hypothetical protein
MDVPRYLLGRPRSIPTALMTYISPMYNRPNPPSHFIYIYINEIDDCISFKREKKKVYKTVDNLGRCLGTFYS